jgi:hypothetical protein
MTKGLSEVVRHLGGLVDYRGRRAQSPRCQRVVGILDLLLAVPRFLIIVF